MIPKLQIPQLSFLRALDKKLVINLGIRYGAVLIFLLIFFLPSIYRFNAIKSKLDQRQSDLARNRARITEGLQMQQNRDLYLNQIRTMEVRFFSEDELTQLLSVFSDLAKKYNLHMTASKPLHELPPREGSPAAPPQTPAPAPPPPAPTSPSPGTSRPSFYHEQEFDVELTGGYHALGRFLSGLRHYSKLFHVRKLSIAGSPKGKPEHQLQLSLSVFSMLEGTR